MDITIQNPSRAWAAGELISTASDLARFLDALFGGRLLGPELLAELRTTVVGSDGRDHGLGLFTMDLPGGVRVWGSSGAYAGYVTFALHAPERGRSLAVAATARSDALVPALLDFAGTVLRA